MSLRGEAERGNYNRAAGKKTGKRRSSSTPTALFPLRPANWFHGPVRLVYSEAVPDQIDDSQFIFGDILQR